MVFTKCAAWDIIFTVVLVVVAAVWYPRQALTRLLQVDSMRDAANYDNLGGLPSTAPVHSGSQRNLLATMRGYTSLQYNEQGKPIIQDDEELQSMQPHDSLSPNSAMSFRPPPVAVAPKATPEEMAAFRARLRNFYAFYCPNKVGDVDRAAELFAGQQEKIFTALVKKYGPEPVPGSASMISQGNMPVSSSVAAAMPTQTTLSGTGQPSPQVSQTLSATDSGAIDPRPHGAQYIPNEGEVLSHDV